MPEVNDFRGLISMWPSDKTLATLMDVAPVTVNGWRARNMIPENRWSDLIAVAKKCGFDEVNFRMLMRLGASRVPNKKVRQRAEP